MQASLERSIVKVLAYFDLFNYPVSEEEILFFLDQPVKRNELMPVLQQLTDAGLLYRLQDYYSLQNDAGLVVRRLKGNRHAQSLLIKAYKISRFLYRFPFVRGVGISGSLSKKFADEDADIDYFIITKSNRLWIARTLMHVYKKLTFLTGRQHWYCMNYYVDEDALQVQEQNIFTATELITLLPVCGNGTMDKFFRANKWAVCYFPNYINKRNDQPKQNRKYISKNIAEWLFNNRLGNKLDNILMKITSRRWKKKELQHRLNMRGLPVGICTDKHYSKPNPSYFQQNVLERYHHKLREVEKFLATPVE